MSRLEARFAALRAQGRKAFIPFITAGDPSPGVTAELLAALPAAGADIIELGMPFSDPMADGPAIQAASQRALKAGQTLAGTLDLVRDFRKQDNETPIVLMGYFNPIYRMGSTVFAAAAAEAGVDGLIVVDVPPEADDELLEPARDAGLNFIRLATPTTDDKRLPAVLANTSGFVYYVSIMGITGTRAPELADVAANIERIKQHTDLPVAVGFGVKTPEQTAAFAEIADAVVVGSAIVQKIAAGLNDNGDAGPELVTNVTKFVEELSAPLR